MATTTVRSSILDSPRDLLAWAGLERSSLFRRLPENHQGALKLLLRLSSCLGMSYVFGWLTLRCGSIWPAALSDGMHKVMPFSSSPWDGQDPPWLE